MKARTMIYLEREELQALRTEARRARISLAELLRWLVREYLRERSPAPRAPVSLYLKIVAMGASGRSDVSERHDDYVAAAARADHAR